MLRHSIYSSLGKVHMKNIRITTNAKVYIHNNYSNKLFCVEYVKHRKHDCSNIKTKTRRIIRKITCKPLHCLLAGSWDASRSVGAHGSGGIIPHRSRFFSFPDRRLYTRARSRRHIAQSSICGYHSGKKNVYERRKLFFGARSASRFILYKISHRGLPVSHLVFRVRIARISQLQILRDTFCTSSVQIVYVRV